MKKISKTEYLISILLILFVLITIFVIGGKTNYIDEYFFNLIIKVKNKPLTNILYVITNIGSTIGTIVAIFITCFIFMRRKRLSDFKYVICNVAVATLLMQTLKSIIKRVRPAWKWISQGGFSYPSGHTITAIVFYGTLILLINKKSNFKYKNLLTGFFIFMIVFISISRIYFGAHYLSDVLASLILGSIILIISNHFINKELEHDKNKIRK